MKSEEKGSQRTVQITNVAMERKYTTGNGKHRAGRF